MARTVVSIPWIISASPSRRQLTPCGVTLSMQAEVEHKIACMIGTCSAEDDVVYQGSVGEEVCRWAIIRELGRSPSLASTCQR
jgi:hypothetical protein